MSFRGYERYLNDFGIMAAETPERFQQCIRKVYTMKPRKSYSREISNDTDRELLTWQACLREFFEKLDKLWQART